jgi:HNH endonuclease
MNTTASPDTTSKKSTGDLSLAFDVGHSSIGWAVLQNIDASAPSILGCSAVIFAADDCLASQRRTFRRQRRHVRSTRQRIARMKALLAHLGVLSREQLDQPGCAWPWQLAARALCGGLLLNWSELWDVLRWYAHNRGYDGNRRWSAADIATQKEDTEKEENAINLMQKNAVTTMAETFCKELGVDPLSSKKSSTVRFKGFNAAFPRKTVEDEVRRILRAHFGKLEKVNTDFERALLERDTNDKLAWQAIWCPDLKLPKRYQGGLLFGQLVPRFDNRIIMRCPITGEKVPTRHCAEFLNFRWGMQLANIRVASGDGRELRPLNVEERKAIDAQMREQGSMTEGELKKAVRSVTRCSRDNLDTMLMHPDAKDALLLDPVRKLTKSDKLKTLWPVLPERVQQRAANIWRRGKAITLLGLRERIQMAGGSLAAFDGEVERLLDAANTKRRRKVQPITREEFLAEPLVVRRLEGRAAYARLILRRAFEEVMAGKHPKEEGGCLFRSEEVRAAQLQRRIDEQTNNHLVRHRLLILERLQRDIVKEYLGGKSAHIGRVTIEINRDLREMSGKTAKEKAQDLGQRLANFKNVAEKLEEAFEGKDVHISPGLIRKARIAEDLGWTCPYTHHSYDAFQLLNRTVDKDHIIPRTERASDSLDSLVITFSAINKWKGKRTAMKFVEDEQGNPVPDMPNLSIVTLTHYKAFVEGLDTFRGHDDDKRRKKNRQRLLLVRDYEKPEFTPRDLTQTSQLVRLGAQVLKKGFTGLERQPVITSMPGSVTGVMRKGWNLIGCLSAANPNVLDEIDQPKIKTEIRDITHLHHALDACVLALASHFIPNNGGVWELIVKRRLDETEQLQLRAATHGIFNFSPGRRFGLADLPDSLKEQIRQRLAERRVVQHVPTEMTGLRVEQNAWRVVGIADGEALLRQRIRQPDGSRPVKEKRERTEKLIGPEPHNGTGKLKRNKAALIIPDNYGLALDPEPTIIPFHKVWTRLQDLKGANNSKTPRVLRNGQLIRVAESAGEYKGIWRVFSTKNAAVGFLVDMGRPDVVRLKNGVEGHKINVRLSSLLKHGVELVRSNYAGMAACPSTLSA